MIKLVKKAASALTPALTYLISKGSAVSPEVTPTAISVAYFLKNCEGEK